MGEEGGKESALPEELVGLFSCPEEEKLEDFFIESRRSCLGDGVTQFKDRSPCGFLNEKAEHGGKADGAYHAHRVFGKPDFGVADGADHASFQVLHPPHIINDREVGNIVAERIDGEVAAHGIFCRGAEDIVAQHHAVFAFQQAG